MDQMTQSGQRLEAPIFVVDAPSVLVVDDDAPVAEVVSMMLEAAGFSVRVTSSAESALALLRENHWDVLVTELNMPGLSGMDLLRRRDVELPAVLMSAAEAHGVDIALRWLNAVWLQKPFTPAQLINVLVNAANRPARPAA
jgi:DNA-binding response OmpR family regulator